MDPDRDLIWCSAVCHYCAIACEIDFHQAWDADVNRSATRTRLSVCLCPSQTDPTARDSAWTTYVGIAGVGRDSARIPDFHPPLDVTRDPNAGIFGYDRWTSRNDITAGIAERLMVVETMRANGPWAQGGPSTVRDIDPDDNPPIGHRRPFGGLHLSGAFVLFADGHADFVSDSVQPAVWQDWARINVEHTAGRKER